MATQGIVTIQLDGEVVLKIIAGSDGMQADLLAKKIKELGTIPTLREAYYLAEKVRFGSSRDRVVVGTNGSFHMTGGSLPDLYRGTFRNPRFNPRWPQGTAEFVVVLNLKKSRIRR